MEKEKRKLKRCIPEGTEIVDLYDDGNLYYKINNTYYPIDLNSGRHPEFVISITNNSPTPHY